MIAEYSSQRAYLYDVGDIHYSGAEGGVIVRRRRLGASGSVAGKHEQSDVCFLYTATNLRSPARKLLNMSFPHTCSYAQL